MRGNNVKLLKRFCSGVMKWSRLTDDEPGEFNNFFYILSSFHLY